MSAKWHMVEGATIDKDKKKSPQQRTEEAVTLAYQAWRRKHNGTKPEAVFVRVPFAEAWEGLPVIGDTGISESVVYVGVTR